MVSFQAEGIYIESRVIYFKLPENILFRLAVRPSLRCGELVALRWRDLQFGRNETGTPLSLKEFHRGEVPACESLVRQLEIALRRRKALVSHEFLKDDATDVGICQASSIRVPQTVDVNMGGTETNAKFR